MQRFIAALCLIFGMLCANLVAAQSFAETNSRAVEAFNAGDMATALALTQEVVEAGPALGRNAPAAYLEALNNLTYLGTLQAIPADKVLAQAITALEFATDTHQRTSAGGLNAQINAAKGYALTGDQDASRRHRRAAQNDARKGEWLGQTLAAAVDIAFLNRDHSDLPSLIAEMIAVSGGYFAQTTLGQLFERQEKREQSGDVTGVSALIDARILIVGVIAPDQLEDFSHTALWPKYYLNYQAESFGAAAKGLRQWAETGTLSSEETAFIADQAEQSLLLAQFQGYSDRDSVQLGFTQLTLTYAELAYPANDHRIGLALREMGAAEGRLGQYARANQTLQDALVNLTQTPEGENSIYLVLEDLASNAWQRGDLDQAGRLFDQAQQAYDAALADGAAPLSDFDRSILLLNRTQLHIEQQAYALAEKSLNKAKDRFAAYVDHDGAKPRDLWHYVSLSQASALLRAETDTPEMAAAAALETAKAAKTYYPALHPRKALALSNAADQLFVSGKMDIGRDLLRQAYKITESALPPDAPMRTEIEVKLALDALAMGDRGTAITYLRSATEARKSPQHRVDLAKVSTDFEIFSWLLLSEPDPNPATLDEALAALQWTQVSQSAEALAMMETRLSAADPQLAVLLKRRQDILGDLELNRSALNGAYADGTDTSGILARQRRLMRDAGSADAALQAAGIALTGQAAITPMKLRDIQALLAPDEVLITFLLPSLSPDHIPGLSGSSNRAIAIRHDDYLIAPVPEESRGALNRQIDAFRCEMAISDTGCGQAVTAALRGSMNLAAKPEANFGFDWIIAHTLYETLFGGIAPLLKEQDRLIIVPPSDLLRLPFQALITEPQPDFEPGSADWLVRHHPVSILPSLAALGALKNASPRPSDELKILGVGDPLIGSAADLNCTSFQMAALRSAPAPAQSLYTGPTQDGLRLANVADLRKMQRLPDATCELRAVQAAFGAGQTDLLLRGEASEAQLKALDATGQLAAYDIIVFATHGVISGETSAIAPGLVLTPPDTASTLDDGLLSAAEVANLTLSARLVILSACNTAAGRDASQEGLSGLASGFFQAGARSLMVTHWAVFSAASAEISTSLAASLAADNTMANATALQHAVLRILNDPQRPARAKHPSYWAPFAIVGL